MVWVIGVGVGAFERETGILDEGGERDDFVLADCLAWEGGVTRNSDQDGGFGARLDEGREGDRGVVLRWVAHRPKVVDLGESFIQILPLFY